MYDPTNPVPGRTLDTVDSCERGDANQEQPTMAEGMEGGRAPLKHSREVTIDALMEHFANDVMDMDEFERRVEAAHAAKTSDELKALLQDMPGSANLPAVHGHGMDPAPIPHYQVTAASHVKENEFIVAVMGGGSRGGRWRPAKKNTVVTVMGGAELDFREAVLGPGVTELRIFALWGGTEVIVPPGMNVEVHGIALMGGFDHQTDESVAHDPTAPTLRVTGVVCMGGVEVTTRHPGETARDARRRRKQLRRERRRRLRGG
jgi:hypothetical protein